MGIIGIKKKLSAFLSLSVSREYFQNGGKQKALEKDEKRAALATKSIQTISIHASSKMEVSTDNSIHSSVMDE